MHEDEINSTTGGGEGEAGTGWGALVLGGGGVEASMMDTRIFCSE